jgi:hypothetical protein
MSVRYGSARLTLQTLLTKLFGVADVQRWRDLENFDLEWSERSKLMAEFIPKGASVIEFGAGRRLLEKFLHPSNKYIPSDLIDRGPGTLVCDLNARSLPDFGLKVDVVTFAGVIEYLNRPSRLPYWLHPFVGRCIISYGCVASHPGMMRRLREGFSRLRNGWVNSYNERELQELFENAGFHCIRKVSWTSETIFVFDNLSSAID